MFLTTGEVITRTLRFEQNQGSDLVYDRDPELRAKAHHRLQLIAAGIHTFAPHWWKNGDGSVVLTAGVGTLPADFATFGEEGAVYLSGAQQPLTYMPPNDLEALLVMSPAVGDPLFYTLKDKTPLGLQKIKTYPSPGSATLLLRNYSKSCPELYDYPVAPAAAVGSAGALTGSYPYRISFVHPTGETEGGGVSDAVAPSSQRNNLTQIPLSPSRLVTARKVWRPAAGGVQYKLAGTISDNLTTTFEDNVADGSLGANMTTPATAVTGIEQFPEDFLLSVFVDGLSLRFMRGQGDTREGPLTPAWERKVREIWANQRPGQNVAHFMPRYGQPGQLYGRRPRIAT